MASLLRSVLVGGLALTTAVVSAQNEQLQAANDIARSFLCLVNPDTCQSPNPNPAAAVHVVTGLINFINGQPFQGATVRITFQPTQAAHIMFSNGQQYRLSYFALQPAPGMLVATFYDAFGNTVSQIEMQFLQPNGGRFRYSSPGQVLDGTFLMQVLALR